MLRNYGLLTPADAEILGGRFLEVARRFPGQTLQVVEIGFREGNTARAIATLLNERGIPFQYHGVEVGRDLGRPSAPFVGAHMVVGDSTEVYHRLPANLHLVFIDGCHCVNHVTLDILHYGARIVQGGELILHDTGERMQGKDYQQHGDPLLPEFSCGVLRALELLRFDDDPRWKQVAAADAANWGGIRAYRRS